MDDFRRILEGYGLKAEQIDQMALYTDFLLEENRKYNLTRITNPADMANKHFIDSVAGEKYIPQGACVIDVGTGAGFPGVPLKIVRPDIELTLLDASHKKIEFIHNLLGRFGINARAVAGRAEELKEMRASFDVAVSRAVAPLPVLLEVSVPLVRIKGRLLAYKGAAAEEELESSTNALKILKCGARLHDAGMAGSEHAIIEIMKLGETPAAYPRRYSKIKSNPL